MSALRHQRAARLKGVCPDADDWSDVTFLLSGVTNPPPPSFFFLQGKVSSHHRTGEVVALFHVCRIARVCESRKPKIFNVDGYDRRELPNII